MIKENNLTHLGGHFWTTHIDKGVLKYAKDVLNCQSMIDVGCGPAGNVILARNMGYNAWGVDGDPELIEFDMKTGGTPLIVQHDYTNGILPENGITNLSNFDLALSTEFLEHVEEKFIPFIMETFQRCKYVICTHALPGETGGYHHVNLKDGKWWINKFDEYGFDYSEEQTEMIHRHSTMVREFMKKTGKVFINRGRK